MALSPAEPQTSAQPAKLEEGPEGPFRTPLTASQACFLHEAVGQKFLAKDSSTGFGIDSCSLSHLTETSPTRNTLP